MTQALQHVFCSNLWAKLQLFNDVDKKSKAWLCLVSLLVSDQLYTAAVQIALESAQFPHYFIECHLQNGRNQPLIMITHCCHIYPNCLTIFKLLTTVKDTQQ